MISDQEIRNARILIVDDQQANVALLEEILHDVGYFRITSTMDPYTVCEMHRANHYDLILLDLQMPGMDGYQVMEALKKIDINDYLPILVITAQTGHELCALAGGAKDVITKPFDVMEVKMRIRNMLEVRLLYKKLEDSNQGLKSLALHDSLTGLPNRRLLMDRLSLAIAHAYRNKHTMALLYLDLDKFKPVNDTFGHTTGDSLLCMVADRLVNTVRQEDTVARLGGDEFVIVLWKLSEAEDADKLALKVIEALSQPYVVQGHNVSITVSIGVSIYPMHGTDGNTLMKSGDLALIGAKHASKNNYLNAAPTELLMNGA